MERAGYVERWLCLGMMVSIAVPALAWSNRGHRLVNLVAAESLPADMPAFMRTPQAIQEISYLGPEPDRWRPDTAPDLSKAASSDHFFRYEAGIAVRPLPRRRYDYLAVSTISASSIPLRHHS